MTKQFILAVDQGTTSSRSILFNQAGEPVAIAQKTFQQHYPKPTHLAGCAEEEPCEELMKNNPPTYLPSQGEASNEEASQG